MKTACIYHSIDLDGWMSTAIVKHWFLQQPTERQNIIIDLDYKGNNMQGSHWQDNTLYMKGYNYGQSIPDLSGYDKVIMVDISFPMNIMTSLSHNLGENFIWIDHHISAIKEWNYVIEPNPQSWILKGVRDTNFAACELTWNYFFPNEPMPEIVRLLGRYDCFGGKGTDEWQKILEFQYGARASITNYEEAYKWLTADGYYYDDGSGIEDIVDHLWGNGIAIYKYLCNEAKQTYKNGFCVTFLNITIPEEEYNFICINKERFNPINFGIDYHSEGYDGVASFHRTKEGKWSFTLYNDNGHVDCSLIAKQYGGGGHKGAAGMILTDAQLLELIK